MHIPDGFLSAPVWLACDLVAAPAVTWIARSRERSPAGASSLPLNGLLGAFVFAAQMINFPVAPGVSGHLLGGALLARTVGPSSAVLTMTAILILQALIFQDGGVLALGANICNMALAGVLAGQLPLRIWGRRPAAVFSGATLSVLAAGALALLQLRLSGIPIQGALLALAAGLFTATAFLEGAITLAVLRAIERMSPQAIRPAPSAPPRLHWAIASAALLLATVGVWAASTAPDSLEHLAAELGLDEQPLWRHAPLPDYEWPGLGWLRKPAAGLVGLASVWAVCTWGGRKR
jgi:cobalt/nickel transport system permease protein